jgi:8-oxo-dGTP pyrophosphatase MutT (NUDIX family)
MRQLTACGMLLFRHNPQPEFLLMRHSWRWDLPKGHQDEGESEQACALREMQEETGITPEQVQMDAEFRFSTCYTVQPPYFNGEWVEKVYIIFLGTVPADVVIQVSEHEGYQWFAWQPPHQLQEFLLDPLLEAVKLHFEQQAAHGADEGS